MNQAQRKPRVLVIDDNVAIHDDFRKILLQHGSVPNSLTGAKEALFGKNSVKNKAAIQFDVDFAVQGVEGLELVRKAFSEGRQYSVAFVDMRMPPGWDGLETIQRLWEADQELQVVICTAYSDRSWEEISETLGLTDRLLILKKPFDPVEVSQLATALSEKWNLRRQASLKFDELERLVGERTRALEHAAQHDWLTDLPNRAFFKDKLNLAFDHNARDANHAFAICFLDFDRFKVVNDSLGHDAGDELLKEIAHRLLQAIQSEDWISQCETTIAARLGGDEFAVLIDGIQKTLDAPKLAQVLLDNLAKSYELKGYRLETTASIGVTTSDTHYATADDALRDADTAMYHAKAAGKAQVVTFDPSMHQSAQDRLRLEHDLRLAIDAEEFFINYQPVVCLGTGALRGFEALIRWNHPQRGLVPPDAFIGCAEETGLINPIGLWVLRTACKQLSDWQSQFAGRFEPFVSVNVSARQLNSAKLLDEVSCAIQDFGVDPSRLVLEITESAVIADPERTIALLHRIKKLGVRIYMDDFGTGYTSLSYLHRLPLDGLKMDRAFMRNVGERRDYAAVVHAIIALARNLGIVVIAEGIESTEQVAMLQSMECEYGQGFYFGRPSDLDAAERIIVDNCKSLAA